MGWYQNRIVPALIYDADATICFGTDTFLNGWARYAHPYDFYAMRYIFAGAEKVREETRHLFADRFGRPDKGKVEGLVGYARCNFMVPIPHAVQLRRTQRAAGHQQHHGARRMGRLRRLAGLARRSGAACGHWHEQARPLASRIRFDDVGFLEIGARFSAGAGDESFRCLGG